MKLAIAQMVLGAAISTEVIAVNIAFGVTAGSVFWVFTHTLPPLGLAVFGCGVAQFLKARKMRIRHEATP